MKAAEDRELLGANVAKENLEAMGLVCACC